MSALSRKTFDRDADLGHGLSWNQVSRLRPVVWDWIDEAKYGQYDNIGFIAQELQLISPECVVIKPEGHLSINYALIAAKLAATTLIIQKMFDEV
jgi:hypothetical protein